MISERERRGPLPGGAEPGLAGGAEPGSGGGSSGNRYTPDEKRALLAEYACAGLGMKQFCAQHGLSTATLCAWRRRYGSCGDAGLEPAPNPRNTVGHGGRRYSPEERRLAVESFRRSGLSRTDFAATFGVTIGTLSKWIGRYEERLDGNGCAGS